MNNWSIDTNCVQAGYRPGNGEPREVPIVQSTTFKYDTSAERPAAISTPACRTRPTITWPPRSPISKAAQPAC